MNTRYKLILDRMVGVHKLHRKVALVGAGNLETDGAIVFPMSSALKSRLTHLEVEVDAKHWNDWAKDQEQNFDDRVTSFIDFRPDLIYTFSPEHTDRTYASPRTWEFVNRILRTVGKVEKKHLPLIAGTIGEGVAREFYGFCQIRDRLPKIEQIIASPNTIEVPGEPSVQFALVGAIAKNATKDNCDALMDFVNRIPPEFQVICVRTMIKRNPAMTKVPSFAPWVSRLAHELI